MAHYNTNPNYVSAQINLDPVLMIAHNALNITSPALYHKTK